jgi:hypothetical protein
MSPFRLGHAGILPMAGTQYLPLIVLAAERTANAAVPARWAALLGALLVVQALHSYYLAYAAFVMTGVLLAVAFAGDPRARARWSWLVGAAGTAALVVVLVSLPYFAARGGGSDAPNPAFVQLASARPGKTGAPAMALVALAALPLWRRATTGRVHGIWVLALACAAVACHLLALGPMIALGAITIPGPFALAAELVPGWQLVRAPVRLGAPAVVGACALAGLALAGALDLVGRRRHAAAMAVGVFAVVVVAVTVRRPLVVAVAETPAMIPGVYRWLATAPRGAVVEIPFHPFRLADRGRAVEARRTYRSVVHWQPLLGGYSGYTPPTYAAVAALAQALPDPFAARMLQRVAGLRWIVLHRDELAPPERRAWAAARAGYRPVARFGRAVVLVPRTAERPDLLAAFLADGLATPLGTPRAPLAAADRRGRLAFATPPPRAPWWRPVSLVLEVRNAGRAVWPGLGATARGLVTVGYRWVDAAGAAAERTDAGRLPWDLAAGARLAVHAIVEPPPRGMRPVRLEIGLVQDGRWFEGALAVPAGGPAAVLSRRSGSGPRARSRRAARDA